MKVLFLLSLISLPAWGFTLNNSAGAYFAQDDVKINVASGFCSNIGVTEEELLAMAQVAMDRYWNSVSSSRLNLSKGSLVTVGSEFNTGKICSSRTGGVCTPNTALTVSSDILIACNTDVTNDNFEAPGSGILAITIPNNVSGSTIVGSLILINDRITNDFQGKSYNEQVAVIAHEVGHALGLGHSESDDSLMYYRSFAERSSLGEDDWDALTYLYPKEEPLSGCGAVHFADQNPTNGGKGPFLPVIVVGFLLVAFLVPRKPAPTC